MENEDIIFTLILHSGDARSKAMEAMKSAREMNIEKANELITEANKSLNLAHKVQTELINNEINGEKTNMSLLLVHAQDHLMTSMVVRDLAKEIILLNNNCNFWREKYLAENV